MSSLKFWGVCRWQLGPCAASWPRGSICTVAGSRVAEASSWRCCLYQGISSWCSRLYRAGKLICRLLGATHSSQRPSAAPTSQWVIRCLSSDAGAYNALTRLARLHTTTVPALQLSEVTRRLHRVTPACYHDDRVGDKELWCHEQGCSSLKPRVTH